MGCGARVDEADVNSPLGGKGSAFGLIGGRRLEFAVLQLRAVHIFIGDLPASLWAGELATGRNAEQNTAQPGCLRCAYRAFEPLLRSTPERTGLHSFGASLFRQTADRAPAVSVCWLPRQQPISLEGTEILAQRGAIHDHGISQLTH